MYAQGCSALSGDQIDQLDIGDLQKNINSISVFYRVSPRHKHKIIKVQKLHSLLLDFDFNFVRQRHTDGWNYKTDFLSFFFSEQNPDKRQSC